MPQSVTIAAFVFGAVLLLIALVGGAFSIFGAEVKEQVGPFRRMIAGVTGAFLLLLAFAQNAPSPSAPPAAAPSAPAAAEAKPAARADTVRPVPAATAAARSVASFAGTYRLSSYNLADGSPGATGGSMRMVAIGDGSYRGQDILNVGGASIAHNFVLRRSGEEWQLAITQSNVPLDVREYEVSVTLKSGVLTVSSTDAQSVWRRL